MEDGTSSAGPPQPRHRSGAASLLPFPSSSHFLACLCKSVVAGRKPVWTADERQL